MTTYYVSKNGNNGAATSWATAKTTIAAGLALAGAGDTVYVAAGQTFAEAITWPTSGTSGNPITLSGDVNNPPIVSGYADHQLSITDKSYIVVEYLLTV